MTSIRGKVLWKVGVFLMLVAPGLVGCSDAIDEVEPGDGDLTPDVTPSGGAGVGQSTGGFVGTGGTGGGESPAVPDGTGASGTGGTAVDPVDPVDPVEPGSLPDPIPVAKAVFVHPGILHTHEDLARLKGNMGKDPWKTAYDKLLKDPISSLEYEPTPFAVVECGGFNNPNIGCNEINTDARAAYTHALLFVLTQDDKHADKAKGILKAWADKFKDITNTNAPLIAAWNVPFWANAAELLRSYDPTWKQSDIKKLVAMFDQVMPDLHKGETTDRVTNWDHSKQEALMAIAIFKDDKPLFERAVKRFKNQLPKYIYLKSDGKTAKNYNKNGYDWWGTKTFVEGLSGETCRDLGHMGGLGFSSLFYAMESAWHQGVDLFAFSKERFLATFKLHGAWMTGDKVVPTNICDDGKVVARLADKEGVKPPNGGGREEWEIAYNHFHTRLGESTPYVEEMVLEARPKGGRGSSRWVKKWETFTHADETF